MPYLNKPKKQPVNREINREIRQKIYNCSRWRNLRTSHLMQYPLCQRCEKEGKVIPAIDVHHIYSFMNEKNWLEMVAIAYNPYNLESLCKICHQKEHN